VGVGVICVLFLCLFEGSEYVVVHDEGYFSKPRVVRMCLDCAKSRVFRFGFSSDCFSVQLQCWYG